MARDIDGRFVNVHAFAHALAPFAKLSVQVKEGSHTVVCRPTTGATKSRSMPVKGGETVLALFKL